MTKGEAVKKPRVKLIGEDGNAFRILGACKRAADKAKWTSELWKAVSDDMKAGNYDHLLQVAMQHFDVY